MAASGADARVLTLLEAGISARLGIPGEEGPELQQFTPAATDALLVIDVQNSFLAGGELEVPQGDEILPLVNALVAKFKVVVLSQDWHPPAHSSFASQHEGKDPYDEVELVYGAQTLWPDHCVQGTRGQGCSFDWSSSRHPSPERVHTHQSDYGISTQFVM
jgi:hypothetical protein